MQKLITYLTLAVFAAVVSVQAAEQTPTTQAATTAPAKASCTASKSACSATTASSSCCSSAKMTRKNVDVKGAVLLAHR